MSSKDWSSDDGEGGGGGGGGGFRCAVMGSSGGVQEGVVPEGFQGIELAIV